MSLRRRPSPKEFAVTTDAETERHGAVVRLPHRTRLELCFAFVPASTDDAWDPADSGFSDGAARRQCGKAVGSTRRARLATHFCGQHDSAANRPLGAITDHLDPPPLPSPTARETKEDADDATSAPLSATTAETESGPPRRLLATHSRPGRPVSELPPPTASSPAATKDDILGLTAAILSLSEHLQRSAATAGTDASTVAAPATPAAPIGDFPAAAMPHPTAPAARRAPATLLGAHHADATPSAEDAAATREDLLSGALRPGEAGAQAFLRRLIKAAADDQALSLPPPTAPFSFPREHVAMPFLPEAAPDVPAVLHRLGDQYALHLPVGTFAKAFHADLSKATLVQSPYAAVSSLSFAHPSLFATLRAAGLSAFHAERVLADWSHLIFTVDADFPVWEDAKAILADGLAALKTHGVLSFADVAERRRARALIARAASQSFRRGYYRNTSGGGSGGGSGGSDSGSGRSSGTAYGGGSSAASGLPRLRACIFCGRMAHHLSINHPPHLPVVDARRADYEALRQHGTRPADLRDAIAHIEAK